MRDALPTTLPAPVSPGEGQERGEPVVHWIFPALEGRITPLPPGSLALGRDADNDVVLEGQQTSRRHAQIERRGNSMSLRDLDSRNGVFVNGARLHESPLEVGDLIRVGDWLGMVRLASPPDETPAQFREILPGYYAGPILGPLLAPVERAAATDLVVVVQGETGTGKEGVAQALHARSGRPGALVALNCGALPEALAEAELFGYRKGAFTGALRDSPGHLRAAHRGTLFLDEIVELPLPVQVKLLRALEQREVLPLGESRAVPVDLRIIVAAQSPLAEQVEKGRMRPDLFARLNGITIALPPLRQRLIELPFLFDRMLRRQAKAAAIPNLDPAAVEALCLHDWPFNLRELDLTVRQLWALHGHEPVLLRSHLPAHMGAARGRPAATVDQPPRHPGPEPDLPALLAALRTTKGNVSKAAEILGINRSKAYRLMGKAEIDLDEIHRLRSEEGERGNSN